MIMRTSLFHIASWLAICGMCMPASVTFGVEATQRGSVSPSAARSATTIRDVALAQGGLLVGQILDEQMKPVPGAKIAIQTEGFTAAATETDADGVFAVAGLRGGVHQVVTEQSIQDCRLWAAGTAPPRAGSHLRLIPSQGTVVRGHWGPPPEPTWKRLATNPFVIGGVVATAVAVPVIWNNIDDDDEGS
jgi:hypothetical protein